METLSPPLPKGKPPPYSVLFVCLGNICRSPMAHGYFEHFLESQPAASRALFGGIDSAGTLAYHAGDSSDPRTLEVLARNGIGGFRHRARKVRIEDFEGFDLILGMDSDNYDDLVELKKRAAVAAQRKKQQQQQQKATGAGDDSELGHVGLFGDFKGWTSSSSSSSTPSKGKARRPTPAAGSGEEVDDPYYGGAEGFDVAYGQMEEFSRGLLAWAEEAAKAHRGQASSGQSS